MTFTILNDIYPSNNLLHERIERTIHAGFCEKDIEMVETCVFPL